MSSLNHGAAQELSSTASRFLAIQGFDQGDPWMSHIPNSAIPHAVDTTELEGPRESGSSLTQRAGKIADMARANPRTAMAAGAAAIAGVAAAATLPFLLGREGGSRSRTRTRKTR